MLNRPFGIMTSFAANRLLRSFAVLGKLRGFCYRYFEKGSREKVYAITSISKGIEGGFGLNVLQRNLKERQERP